MTRTRIALTLTTAGLAGVLTLTGCGAPGAAPAEDVAGEAAALTTVAAVQQEPGQRPGGHRYLRKNTLHGEIAVQGKDGVQTIVVQRGTVTAVDAKTLSVKSADGFTQSWTIGDKLRVVQDKKKVAADAVKTGAEVGVAGRRDGDAAVARLVRLG